jgi:hypothetical protein
MLGNVPFLQINAIFKNLDIMGLGGVIVANPIGRHAEGTTSKQVNPISGSHISAFAYIFYYTLDILLSMKKQK